MRRIGIVEDDKKLSEELKNFLEHHGYIAEIVKPEEYITEIILSKNFALLLLDIGLPQTDGLYLCREIRKKSNLPMIIITSKDTEIMELMSISSGADDFVTKPFHIQILLARMERLLFRAYPEQSEQTLIKFGMLTFDKAKGILYTKEESVELTRNEIKILLCLTKKINQIVSRDEIINMLWDSELFVDDNTLTVNMTRLRAKFKLLHAENLIQTKRGLGYRLCDS